MSHGSHQPAYEVVEVMVEGRGVHLAAFETDARQRGGTRVGSRERAPEAVDHPLTGGGIPFEPSVRIQQAGYVHALIRGQYGALRSVGQVDRHRQERICFRSRRVRMAQVDRLFFDVVNSGAAVRSDRFRIGQHEEVLVVGSPLPAHLRGQALDAEIGLSRLRARKLYRNMAAPGDGDRVGYDKVHRIFGFHPGTAAAGPAGPGNQRELDTEPFALFSRVFEQLDPLVAHEIYRTARDADIYFEEDDTADSGALHRFEVGFDSLAR